MELTITKLNFEKIKHQALIIDVRDSWEHKELKKLPNGINIHFLELVSKPENYISNKNQLVITYRNYGNCSGQSAKMLREKGYLQTFVLEGGTEGYFLKSAKKLDFQQKIKLLCVLPTPFFSLLMLLN